MGELWYFYSILRYFSKANMPLRKTVRYFLTVYRDILWYIAIYCGISRYFDDIYGYSQSSGRKIIFINISIVLIM